MSTAPRPEQSQSELLAALIEKRGLSVRGLARALAKLDKEKGVESWRRAIYKWLNGGGFLEDSADLLAQALGDITAEQLMAARPAPASRKVQIQLLEERVADLEEAMDRLVKGLGDAAE